MVVINIKDSFHIKKLIALKGRSIRGFSKDIGVSHSHLSQVLNEKKRLSPTTAKKIADGLDLNMAEFFLIKVVDEQPLGGGEKYDPGKYR